jgi:hypothetical protein
VTTKTTMLKNVRLFCQECMGGVRAIEKKWPISNVSDVDGCEAVACIWHVFRHGKDPKPEKRSKPPSEKQLEARRNFGKKESGIADRDLGQGNVQVTRKRGAELLKSP